MRMTARKREILEQIAAEWWPDLESDIGLPPYDLSGICYLVGMDGYEKQDRENVRRTLESMVADGLLEKRIIRQFREGMNEFDRGSLHCSMACYAPAGLMEAALAFRAQREAEKAANPLSIDDRVNMFLNAWGKGAAAPALPDESAIDAEFTRVSD